MLNSIPDPTPSLNRLLLFAGMVAASITSVWAMPTVSGNTISWTDDDWYQVQDPVSFESLCEGRLACTVEPGVYNVINLTTGERFTDVLVAVAGGEAFSVEGMTISWSGNDWYQVQRADDFSSVCNGGQHCDVQPGEYIVINHTTGERYESVVVTGESSDSETRGGVSIVGSTIAWSGSGWYQVQHADTFVTWCEGGSSCTVEDGVYHVINHTSGERVENVVVSTGNQPIPPAPGEAPNYLCNVKIAGEHHYCYDQGSRLLTAYLQDDVVDWSYTLPVDGQTHAVWGIYASSYGGVDLLVHDDSGKGLFELYRFNLDGGFLESRPLLTELSDVLSFSPGDWTALVRGRRMILAGEACRVDSADGVCVPFLAVVNDYDGSTNAYRELGSQYRAQSLSLSNWSLLLGDLELDAESLIDVGESEGIYDAVYDMSRGLDDGTVESTGQFLTNYIYADPLLELVQVFLGYDDAIGLSGGIDGELVDSLTNFDPETTDPVVAELACGGGSGNREITAGPDSSFVVKYLFSSCEYGDKTLDGDVERVIGSIDAAGIVAGYVDESFRFLNVSIDLPDRSIVVADAHIDMNISGMGNDDVGTSESSFSGVIDHYSVTGAQSVTVTNTQFSRQYNSLYNYSLVQDDYSVEDYYTSDYEGSFVVTSDADPSRSLEFLSTERVMSVFHLRYGGGLETIDTSSYSGALGIKDSNGNSLLVSFLDSGKHLYEIIDNGVKTYRIMPYSGFAQILFY